MTRSITAPAVPLQGSLGGRTVADVRARTLDRLIENVRRLTPADGVAFLVVDEELTRIEPVADWYANEELREAVAPAHSRPYSRTLPGLPEITIERDLPLLLPRVEAWEASAELRENAAVALGEENAERIWRLYRTASVACCPVKTALGRPLGVLIVASLDPKRRLGRRDLHAVEMLAESAALVLERSTLLTTEANRAREELLLKRAAEAVASSLEPNAVYETIVEHAVHVSGGTKALLTRFQPGATELVTAATVDFNEEVTQGRYSMEGSMLGRVARTRKPYVSRSADRDRWDRRVVRSENLGSFMHVPIVMGPRLFGVLTVGHHEEDRFTESDLELLGKLARISAAGIANAIDFERERRVARALTLGFVPESMPELPGYEVGLTYEPAANQPVGGDVYGAWPLQGGEVAVLVGDVAGKGVETAALSSMVRFFLEARSWDESDPAVVLAQANTMLRSRLPADTFVTAFLGLLSSSGLRYANAGHLPPLLLRHSGEVASLAGRGLPLGIDASPGYTTEALALESGDLVFGYTDGLIEARHEGQIYGDERLRKLVTERSRELDPAALVRAVHDEVAGWADGLADDAVALALRRR
jgi:serine phosphatase RsbU (regulator of sigma subunit)